MTDKLDQHALAHLTDEERKLLAEEGDTLLECALVPDAGTNVHGAPRGSEPEPEHASRAPRADRGGDEDELRRDPTPLLDTNVPHDLPQRLAALNAQEAGLVARFDDGEITAREYSDGLQAIADKRSDIEWMRRKAEFAREQHETAINRNWGREVERFLTGPAKDIAEKGEGALLAFDSYVKKVTSDPANARLSDRAQLMKAYKAFEADFGKLPASGVRRANVDRARAEEPTRGGNDSMERALAGNDQKGFNRAFARMSPEEQDEWLR
ncbi:MAG: hypothetical protein ACR652_01305 [Methylocystis sp.]|uniref:hypothetical protein n=1 Tax=Methylocystis sp. TaxID=1911079 RepID=UPI003DA1D851